MPQIEPGKAGIFTNPVIGTPTVEDQKKGVFALPAGVTTNTGVSGMSASAIKTDTPASAIQFSTVSAGKEDWRVKVSVTKGSGVLYDDPNPGIMAPLVSTNGVIFPYVPAVTVAHAAKYSTQSLTHSNYNNYFYESSEVQAINITADFTVQNTYEAKYFLAAVYFFRAATKMFYGESKMYQGAPPPIIYLDGYGAHYLPHVSCVVTAFSHTMPSDVDYIEVTIGTSATRVPTSSQFTIGLQPVYSRTNQRKFSFDAFARGELIVGPDRLTGYL